MNEIEKLKNEIEQIKANANIEIGKRMGKIEIYEEKEKKLEKQESKSS